VKEGRGAIQLCLDEIDRCRPWFIALLGERFGWRPSKYVHDSVPKLSWLDSWKTGDSITALEIYYGFLGSFDRRIHSFAFMRNSDFLQGVPFSLLPLFKDDNSDAVKKLNELKSSIRKHPHCKVRDYRATFSDGDPPGASDLDSFCEEAYKMFKSAAVDEYAQATVKFEKASDVEAAYQKFFMESRVGSFQGRDFALQRLCNLVLSSKSDVVVVHGKPGSGKSSIMAKFVQNMSSQSSTTLVFHFVGATSGSVTLPRVLQRLCQEIMKQMALPNTATSTPVESLSMARRRLAELSHDSSIALANDPDKLFAIFQKLLTMLAPLLTSKLVIVIDALNQLDRSNSSQSMWWLPVRLPPQVKFVVSTLDGVALDSLKKREPPPVVLPLDPLTKQEQESMVQQLLGRYGKHFSPDELAALLNRKGTDTGSPLYLTACCEELRIFQRFEGIKGKICALPSSLEELFEQVLCRLESDDPIEGLTAQSLSLLACARDGLTESELIALLGGYENESQARAYWCRVYHAIAFLLRPINEADCNSRIDFFHRQFGKAVRTRYLMPCHKLCAEFDRGDFCPHLNFLACNRMGMGMQEEDEEDGKGKKCPVLCEDWKGRHECEHVANEDRSLAEIWGMKDGTMHGMLADMFKRRADPCENESYENVKSAVPLPPPTIVGYSRGLSELVYHFSQAGMWQDVKRCLTDLRFIQARVAMGLVSILLTEYTLALDSGDMFDAADRQALQDFYYFVRAEAPTLSRYPQLTFQQALNEPDGGAPSIAARQSGQCLLMWCNKLQKRSANLFTITEHKDTLRHMAWSHDGVRICSASNDSTVRVFSGATGEEQICLTGHAGKVTYVAFSLCNQFIFSAGNGMIKCWDADTGREVYSIDAQASDATPLTFALSPTGNLIAFPGKDFLVCVADSQKGIVLRRLKGHSENITKLVFSANSKLLLTSSRDFSLKVWDAQTGAKVNTVSHKQVIRDFAISPDSTQIAVVTVSKHLWVYIASDMTRMSTSLDIDHFAGYAPQPHPVPAPAAISVISSTRPLATNTTATSSSSAAPTMMYASGSCLYHTDGKTNCKPKPVYECAPGLTVNYSAWSPSGRRFLASTNDGTIFVLDIQSLVPLCALQGHTSPILHCAWFESPIEGQRLASCAAKDSRIKVWDPSGDSTSQQEAAATKNRVDDYRTWCLTSTGNTLLTSPGGTDKLSVRVCDVPSAMSTAKSNHSGIRMRLGHPSQVIRMVCSDDGRLVTAHRAKDNQLVLWLWTLANDGNKVAELTAEHGEIIQWSFGGSDSSLFLSISRGRLLTWNLPPALGMCDNHSAPGPRPPPPTLEPAKRMGASVLDAITCFAMSPVEGFHDELGPHLIWGTKLGNVSLAMAQCEGETTTLLFSWKEHHKGSVLSCSWSPDGTKIATAGEDCVKIWSTNTPPAQLAVLHSSSPVTSIAFWGQLIVTACSQSKELTVWRDQTSSDSDDDVAYSRVLEVPCDGDCTEPFAIGGPVSHLFLAVLSGNTDVVIYEDNDGEESQCKDGTSVSAVRQAMLFVCKEKATRVEATCGMDGRAVFAVKDAMCNMYLLRQWW